MSYVNEYIQTFAGEAALSLLRCMAVANGNNSLDSITLTQSEATRYIVTYQENPAIETYHSWKELREEIYTTIHNYRTDTISLRRYICRMLMDVRLPAAYYHCSERTDQNSQEINAFFACIMNCLQKAHSMLEAVGYMKIPLGDYNRKWDKKSFHDIRTIGLALERLGNIIQGCLYENDIRTPVFDYQSQCGVKLVETITIDSLVEAMDWTQTMAHNFMDVADSKKIIAPLSTIPELAQAKKDLQIDDKGHLLVSNRAFVMYCYEHRFFLPLNKKDWKKIDGMLTSDQGKTLSAGDLAKVAQQLNKEFYFDKAIRYGK
jgi:hypothetical protein